METLQNWINNESVPSCSGETFDNYNPATGQPYQQVACGGREDVNRAVAAAKEAFEGEWGQMQPAERGAYLYRIAELIEERTEELARIETTDVGKPIRNTLGGEVPLCAPIFRYYAGLCDKLRATVHLGDPNYLSMSLSEPYGVCGLIVPWNYPLVITAVKTAPALAAGNAVVVKVSVDTPASATAMGQIIADAGVPAGVYNVVHGPGSTVGQALAEHPDVPKLSFTGSTATGKALIRAGAEHIKVVTLELGGKTGNIVFPDADLDAAVSGALFTAYVNTGQICTSGSRLLVHEEIADEFISELVNRARQLKIGDPMQEDTNLGPIISRSQFQKIREYIQIADQENELIYRGEVPEGLGDGWFMAPTIYRVASNQCRLAQEEVFGPVLAVLTFRTEEEAVAIANGTQYGLAATFWTRDFSRVMRLSRNLKAGIIWGNICHYLNPDVPYGGIKLSGHGLELGIEGMRAFTRGKCVFLNAGPDKISL